MNTSYHLIALMLLSLPISSVNAQPLLDAERGVLTYASNIEKSMASVVYITVVTEKPRGNTSGLGADADKVFGDFLKDRPDLPKTISKRSAGTGVIIDADQGHIVTTLSIPKETKKLVVKLQDGREYEAMIIGQDIESKVTLLKIEADNLTSVSIVDPLSTKVGDVIFLIGNPYGFKQTVTSGIVNHTQRDVNNPYIDFIQYDAALSSACKGCPIVNSKSELIGINHTIIKVNKKTEGITFALPASIVTYVVNNLLQHGKVRHGTLGVVIKAPDNDILRQLGTDQSRGALVSDAVNGGAAADAGIQSGDLILAFNNQEILNTKQLVQAVRMYEIGKPVQLTIWRNGQTLELEARTEELTPPTDVVNQ